MGYGLTGVLWGKGAAGPGHVGGFIHERFGYRWSRRGPAIILGENLREAMILTRSCLLRNSRAW